LAGYQLACMETAELVAAGREQFSPTQLAIVNS
jgi:hypothetical protein